MGRPRGSKDMCAAQRDQILGFLRASVKPDGTLRHGAKALAARTFNCDRNQVRVIWERAAVGLPQPKRGGSEKKYNVDALREAIKEVPPFERMNVRAAGEALGVPYGTLQRYIGRDGPLRRVTVHVKPTLTEEQKIERLRFVFCFVERPIGTFCVAHSE